MNRPSAPSPAGPTPGGRRGVPRHSILALAALVAACSACASAGTGAWSGPPCRSTPTRDILPVAPILDSAALQREAADVWTPGTDLVLATLVYDSTGVRDTVRVFSRTLPEPGRDRLRARLAAAAMERGEPGDTVHLIIGEAAGPTVRRVPHFRRCEPVLVGAPQVVREMNAETLGLRVRARRVVGLHIFVDEEGTVGDVRIAETSGDLRVDLAAARPYRRARFTPATIEGLPVAVWIHVPVTISPAGR